MDIYSRSSTVYSPASIYVLFCKYFFIFTFINLNFIIWICLVEPICFSIRFSFIHRGYYYLFDRKDLYAGSICIESELSFLLLFSSSLSLSFVCSCSFCSFSSPPLLFFSAWIFNREK